MNKLSISAYSGLTFGALYLIWSYLFKLALSWRGFGTTPAGQGLAALVL